MAGSVIPADRLACCVPHCGRTIRRGAFDEWICHVHWSPVRGTIRSERNAAKRAVRKLGPRRAHPEGTPQRDAADAAWDESARTWQECKAAAIEIAMGIR